MEGCVPLAPPCSDSEELVDRLLDLVGLFWGEVGQQLSQEADQVENDDEGAVEISDVSLLCPWCSRRRRRLGQVLLSRPHLRDGLVKDSHDITKVDRGMVGRR